MREDAAIFQAMAEHLRSRGVHSISMVDRIIGCPHEEEIDYPSGEDCPYCPYWAGRDRWSDD